MNTNTVCIFPDTIPRAEILFPLVQVFEPVVYLRPVENDPPAAADLSPLCREMVEQCLIRFDCTAPLLDNRDRFVRLVQDLQHRRDDYAGQLSNLSLAGLGNQDKTETKASIISTLLKQSGIQKEHDEHREMILWQARLLLKLAEIFDREQDALQENLERISSRENGLLEKLREEDEQPFSLTRTLAAAEGRKEGQLRLRIKAWSRLFALGDQRIDASTFITTSRDAFDLLIEHYELEQERPAQLVLTLQLPGSLAGDNFVEQRIAFTNAASKLIDTLQRLLDNPVLLDENDCSALDGPDSIWNTLLEQHYPAAESGRCSLSLYFLPAVTPARLFLNTFGRDKDDKGNGVQSAESEGIILGILQEQVKI